MNRKLLHDIDEQRVSEKMDAAAQFELISPSASIRKTKTNFVLIYTHFRGLKRLRELCTFFNITALFIDDEGLMYISDVDFETLMNLTIRLRENSFAIDSGMDITVPKLFYDLIFNQAENQLNMNDKLKYIRESNMHLKEQCELSIDTNSYSIVTVQKMIKKNPALELDLSYFDIEFLHSFKFMHYFQELCHPNGYYSVDEDNNSIIHPDYSFCPDILLRKRRFHDVTEEQLKELYLEWKCMIQAERKLLAKFECYRGGRAYDMYPMTQTCETHGMYSLRHIFDFCNWAMGIEQITNLYWYIQDVEILMDLIKFLRDYRHIKLIDDFFIEREQTIKWYINECNERRVLINKYKQL